MAAGVELLMDGDLISLACQLVVYGTKLLLSGHIQPTKNCFYSLQLIYTIKCGAPRAILLERQLRRAHRRYRGEKSATGKRLHRT